MPDSPSPHLPPTYKGGRVVGQIDFGKFRGAEAVLAYVKGVCLHPSRDEQVDWIVAEIQRQGIRMGEYVIALDLYTNVPLVIHSDAYAEDRRPGRLDVIGSLMVLDREYMDFLAKWRRAIDDSEE